MSGLRGKVIAVTGAASGIGRAVATMLAEHGSLLSIADVNEKQLTAVGAELTAVYEAQGHASSLPEKSAPVFTYALDVRKPEAVQAWIDATVAHFKTPLYGAANIAGVIGSFHMTPEGRIRNAPADGWDFVMDVNAKGTFNCLKAQLGVIQQGDKGRGGGSIVNASSTAGLIGLNSGSLYAASKHAIIALTKSAAKEEGAKGIRVNCIAPGIVDTPMVTGAEEAGATVDFRSGSVPGVLGRMADAKEVANVVVFLLSDGASYITGATIPVDGGWTC